jgi:RNA polymerase sigma factor (sigma-70 family)
MNLFDSLPKPHAPEVRPAIEKRLAAQIAAGSEHAVNELVMANMHEAALYTRSISRNLDEGTLISICYETLVRNAKRFDPSRQRFFAFAKAGLRGALYRNYNKETQHHPAPEVEIKSQKFVPRVEGENGDMPDYEPINDALVAEADYQTIFTRDQWANIQPIVAQKCSDRERMVLVLNYLSGLNFQEIGHLLGVTRSAIQRTHWRAIKKLRHALSRQRQLFSE